MHLIVSTLSYEEHVHCDTTNCPTHLSQKPGQQILVSFQKSEYLMWIGEFDWYSLSPFQNTWERLMWLEERSDNIGLLLWGKVVIKCDSFDHVTTCS